MQPHAAEAKTVRRRTKDEQRPGFVFDFAVAGGMANE